jgi:hypothetical protein
VQATSHGKFGDARSNTQIKCSLVFGICHGSWLNPIEKNVVKSGASVHVAISLLWAKLN